MEAEVGIEPAYTDLQSDYKKLQINALQKYHFRNGAAPSALEPANGAGLTTSFTDVASLRCGVPTSSGFLSLTLDYLVRFTGLHPRRAERAMADLKRANLMTVKQARQLQEDGTWRGLAAVKAVNKLLFTAFGLGMRLRHERDRASKRLAKKATRLGETLTGWARNALVMGRPRAPKIRPSAQGSQDRSPPGVDAFTYQQARTELLVALMQTNSGLSADEYYAEADRILHARMHA